MQRKTRVLLRAAKWLEREAQDYVLSGQDDPGESAFCGRRAKVLFGLAYSVRQIAATGYAPSSKEQNKAK